MIKAIETEYNGYKFRSRLEARWAVFFDYLGVSYEYEPEGFTLSNGQKYLPDFRVKCWGTRGEIWSKPFDLYIEVKGVMTACDAARITEFANIPDYSLFDSDEEYEQKRNSINSVLIVGNIPNPRNWGYGAEDLNSYDQMDGISIYPWNYETIDGDYFAAYPAVDSYGRFYLDGDDSNYQTMDKRIIFNAFKQARQARFEHGEKPII